MNLLIDDIEVIETAGDPSTVDIGGIAHDSRRVVPGDLFCCVPGHFSDGHDHATEAVERGAVGILCEHFIPQLLGQPVVQTRIAPGTARPVMARLAAAFYGNPARDLLMVGVTGTNGKTTVTQILGDVLDATGRPTNVMGTLSGARTTPEATEVQRVLAGVRDRQRADGRPHAVAMEVSSHALVQSRVEGVHFDVAVFTNLSHDHLDYHGSMESYYEAKRMLFTPHHALAGIVNADDAWGRRLMKEARIPVTPVRWSDAGDVVLHAGHSTFSWRGRPVDLPLTGAVNVGNALLAAEAALALGAGVDEVAAALSHVSAVPGRLQVVAVPGDGGGARPPYNVMVDYAHTPAGLEVVLGEARALTDAPGRVLVVFGCGGNRDRAKRPKMGRAALSLSDVAVLTSDNPRDEDPLDIIAEVRDGIDPGAAGAATLIIEPDRRVAIRRAMAEARPGDFVVIAGKGHENYQEIAGRRHPFDDVEESRQALSIRYPSDPLSWLPARQGDAIPRDR